LKSSLFKVIQGYSRLKNFPPTLILTPLHPPGMRAVSSFAPIFHWHFNTGETKPNPPPIPGIEIVVTFSRWAANIRVRGVNAAAEKSK
jgi:hypothetical protein